MKRVLLGLVAVVAAFVVGRWIVLAFVSDETKIRWLVEEMEEGYDEGDLSDCVGPLHEDWRHEGYSIDREFLKAGLFRAFREERDRDTGERTSRVDVDEDGMVVEVDGDSATIEVEAVFARLQGDAWKDTWEIRVTGELERGGDGWKIVRTRHEDVKGTQLSR